MRRQPRTEGLLLERSGLAEPPRKGALGLLAPLLALRVLAAIVVYTQRAEDGTLEPRSLWVADAFAALGAAATVSGFLRAALVAKQPVEGLLVRVGLRDTTYVEPGIPGEAPRAHRGASKPRWVLALEDGSKRFVWPLNQVRGKERLTRGAGGVAWVKGPHLVGFEPIE